MTNLPKGKTVYTNNLQPEELIKMEFYLYSVTFVQGFAYMLTLLCAKNRIVWVFTT